ncbi:MAG: dienelactone hydrolase family protein [Acidimicrobiia bacterium]
MEASLEALRFGFAAWSGESWTLRVGGDAVPAYHARPDGMPVAGIVIATDIGGLRPLFTDMADRLSSHGLAVMVVEPFARQPEAQGKAPADRFVDVGRLRDREQVGDLVAAADALVVHDNVARVALLGFCMGGMFALKGAASGRFDWTVACYGMIRLPDAWVGPGLQHALDVADSAGPTLAVFGSEDPWTPPADVDALRACWADHRDCEVLVVEGADHGFVHDPERPTHRVADARMVWDRIIAWGDGDVRTPAW